MQPMGSQMNQTIQTAGNKKPAAPKKGKFSPAVLAKLKAMDDKLDTKLGEKD